MPADNPKIEREITAIKAGEFIKGDIILFRIPPKNATGA